MIQIFLDTDFTIESFGATFRHEAAKLKTCYNEKQYQPATNAANMLLIIVNLENCFSFPSNHPVSHPKDAFSCISAFC